MNTVVPSCAPASFPIPEFGRSADGLTVARIGDAAYAMIPIAGGRYFLGSGWSLSKPLSDWKRSDFYGHGGDVAIGLPEQEIARFSVGQPVLVELWSRQGERLPGTIRELAATADPQARTFAAKITVAAGDVPVELGQTARVFMGSGANGELAVPLSAIGGEAGEAFVWVVEPAHARAVRTPVLVRHWGERDATLESGLAATDWIVVGGVHLIREGQMLRPIDRDNRPVDLAAGNAP